MMPFWNDKGMLEDFKKKCTDQYGCVSFNLHEFIAFIIEQCQVPREELVLIENKLSIMIVKGNQPAVPEHSLHLNEIIALRLAIRAYLYSISYEDSEKA